VKAEHTTDILAACEVSSVTRLFNFGEDANLGNVDILGEILVVRYSAGKTINTPHAELSMSSQRLLFLKSLFRYMSIEACYPPCSAKFIVKL
jgi:hypothetical protein